MSNKHLKLKALSPSVPHVTEWSHCLQHTQTKISRSWFFFPPQAPNPIHQQNLGRYLQKTFRACLLLPLLLPTRFSCQKASPALLRFLAGVSPFTAVDRNSFSPWQPKKLIVTTDFVLSLPSKSSHHLPLVYRIKSNSVPWPRGSFQIWYHCSHLLAFYACATVALVWFPSHTELMHSNPWTSALIFPLLRISFSLISHNWLILSSLSQIEEIINSKGGRESYRLYWDHLLNW